MVKKFCPKCGKTIQEGILCSDCTTKELHYEPILIQVSEFNRVFEQGRWKHFDDIEQLILRRLKEALGNRKDVDIHIDPFEFTPAPKTKVKLTASATIDGTQVALPLTLGYKQCDFGQKQKTSYYEGILQLRRPTEDVLAYIERELHKQAPKGVFITKTVETQKGVDLYFTNKDAMKLLAQKLPSKFGGTISINAQLFSRNKQRSQDIYRLNILVEFPEFSVGHVISFTKNNNSYTARITKMGKIIQGKDVQTGKLVSFELKFVSDINVEDLHETTVVQTEPTLLALDPETFQGEQVTNEKILKDTYSIDDTVVICKTTQGFFVVE